MAFTSRSVVGHPSVVNFRLIQPSSRYHPVSPCSASLPGISASVYDFSSAMFRLLNPVGADLGGTFRRAELRKEPVEYATRTINRPLTRLGSPRDVSNYAARSIDGSLVRIPNPRGQSRKTVRG